MTSMAESVAQFYDDRTRVVAIMAAILVTGRGGNGAMYDEKAVANEALELFNAVRDVVRGRK